METIAKFQDVDVTLQGRPILKNIQFEMQRGQQWALIGLNGSGKTTLLNILAAYQFPSNGTVEVIGETFGKTYIPDLRKKIGFVSNALERFSDYYRNDTIERVVLSGKHSSFGIYEEITEEDEAEALQLLEQFRIAQYAGKKFHELSEGEKRRVLIARALMSHPDILILDEPCSGLDILAREQFLQSLEVVIERGCHIIYVTHHIEEVMPHITHAVLLKEGEIIAQGEKQEVLTAERLSETFNTPVSVTWHAERPYVTVNGPVQRP
ncbi:ABC transporter ATP-binding protein [Savagea faecisuis]|uniref:ABC transporter ATP-binding protein n=1 Tax=Savagea faecisuis TaxID=1274803 RepID=A0ABW3GW37_9BACL